MAVRQHLYELEAEGMVESVAQPGGVGRPAKRWRLTPAADRFFPDGHADLTTGLIGAMRAAFGEDGVDMMLEVRSREQTAAYGAAMADKTDLGSRLERLAALRTEEGYMADRPARRRRLVAVDREPLPDLRSGALPAAASAGRNLRSSARCWARTPPSSAPTTSWPARAAGFYKPGGGWQGLPIRSG